MYTYLNLIWDFIMLIEKTCIYISKIYTNKTLIILCSILMVIVPSLQINAFFKTSFNLIEWLFKDQIFAKFNLDIVSPPPYEREIWHYQKVNIDLITRAINSFDWEKAFSNIYFDKMAFISNQTIINILCNFISLILF